MDVPKPPRFGVRFGNRHTHQTLWVPTRAAAYRIANAIYRSKIGSVIILNNPGSKPVTLPFRGNHYVY